MKTSANIASAQNDTVDVNHRMTSGTPQGAIDSCDSVQDVVNLCPGGDLQIMIKNADDVPHSFLTSSQVLSLSSIVFKAMLQGQMSEAQAILAGTTQIELKEDDPEAMGIILSVLHHGRYHEDRQMDVDLLASVAVQADKYDCTRPLQPWVLQWLREAVASQECSGSVLRKVLIAWKMRNKAAFVEYTRSATMELSGESLQSLSRTNVQLCLPQDILGQIGCSINTAIDDVWRIVSDVETTLRSDTTMIPTEYMECLSCGRRHPPTAKRCHPCGTTDVRPRVCTNETRVSEYLSWLKEAELFGPRGFAQLSLKDIIHRMQLCQMTIRHACAAKLGCPLMRKITTVITAVTTLCHGLRGLQMEDVRSDV